MAFQVRLGTTSAIATNGTGVEGTTMITVPFSSTYKTTSTTLVSQGRNTNGVLKISVVRAGIRKVELSWRVLTIADYSKLASFFNDNFSFFALYFDQESGTWLTKEFYVGDRIADALKQEQWVVDTNYGDQRYKPQHVENVKISLIEV